MIWSAIVARALSMILSWLDSGNLRNRLYHERERCEIMQTALEDIVRMDSGGRLGRYAHSALKLAGVDPVLHKNNTKNNS
jgi:hypothetical protein